MKNKKVILIVSIIVVILIIAGGYYFIFGRSRALVSQNSAQDQVIQKLSAKQLGLSLSESSDKKQVQFMMTNVSGIQSVEYELTYEANSTPDEIAQGGNPRVDRGITGQANIQSGASSYTSPWLDLGTCSSGTCHYDTGVNSVDLTLKITKSDGSVYQAEQNLKL